MEMSARLRRQGMAGEAFLREQLEAASKEIKQLKAKMDQLEKENASLKKSVYDLSLRVKVGSKGIGYYDLDAVVDVPNAVLHETHEAKVTYEEGNGHSSRDANVKDPRLHQFRHDLRGHTGAVYVVQFSPCGRFLASGSFDKTVRVWDSTSPRELKRLEKHTLNVSDVAWSADSSLLLSGAYDQTCALWDVEQGKPLSSHRCEGFVQCCMMSAADSNIFFCGTTRKYLCMFDRRLAAAAVPQVLQNDTMVNSIYVSLDGTSVITGDAGGCVKTWDVRTGRTVHSFFNDPRRKPISHLHVSKRPTDEDEPPMLAVNSYDNVVRVYDRSTFRAPPAQAPSAKFTLTGVRNQNWPIKSAFFRGADHVFSLPSRGDTPLGTSADDEAARPMRTAENSMLLASGSAENHAYLFDVSDPSGTGELLQQLEGHTDRVYATAFHPSRPMLATCSADFTLKIWSARTQKPTSKFLEWADQ